MSESNDSNVYIFDLSTVTYFEYHATWILLWLYVQWSLWHDNREFEILLTCAYTSECRDFGHDRN